MKKLIALSLILSLVTFAQGQTVVNPETFPAVTPTATDYVYSNTGGSSKKLSIEGIVKLIQAGNGLTRDNFTIELGGTMTEPTTINTGGFNLILIDTVTGTATIANLVKAGDYIGGQISGDPLSVGFPVPLTGVGFLGVNGSVTLPSGGIAGFMDWSGDLSTFGIGPIARITALGDISGAGALSQDVAFMDTTGLSASGSSNITRWHRVVNGTGGDGLYTVTAESDTTGGTVLINFTAIHPTNDRAVTLTTHPSGGGTTFGKGLRVRPEGVQIMDGQIVPDPAYYGFPYDTLPRNTILIYPGGGPGQNFRTDNTVNGDFALSHADGQRFILTDSTLQGAGFGTISMNWPLSYNPIGYFISINEVADFLPDTTISINLGYFNIANGRNNQIGIDTTTISLRTAEGLKFYETVENADTNITIKVPPGGPSDYHTVTLPDETGTLGVNAKGAELWVYRDTIVNITARTGPQALQGLKTGRVSGDWSVSDSSLIYTGSIPITWAEIGFNLSYTTTATTAESYVEVFKNDVLFKKCAITRELGVLNTDVTAGQSAEVTVNPGDYFELKISVDAGTPSIQVKNLNFRIRH